MNSNAEMELYRVATRTFDEIAFMFVATGDDGEKRPSGIQPEATATVTFCGPFEGKLAVKVYGGLLPAIASNMLGEEGLPSLRQQHDALGEIANIICGNVLPAITGPTEIFRLDTPQVVSGDIPSLKEETPSVRVELALDQGAAELLLFAGKP